MVLILYLVHTTVLHHYVRKYTSLHCGLLNVSCIYDQTGRAAITLTLELNPQRLLRSAVFLTPLPAGTHAFLIFIAQRA